jgi:hypothetical protein
MQCRTNTPLAGVTTLLKIPYHGVPLLSLAHLGLGLSSKGSVAEFDGVQNLDQAAGIDVYSYDADPNTPISTEHVWPFNGARNVPSIFVDREVPDPLAGYTGNHSRVGPLLYFSTLLPEVI